MNYNIFRSENAISGRLRFALSVLSIVVSAAVLLPVYAQDNYGNWNYSTNILLNTSSGGANVSGSVSDFPVLIHLNPDNFPYFSQTNAGGTDIRFASSGGTHLSYEIERWVDGTSDSAWIWVKTDVTGNSSTQYIVMYWGNAGAADSSDGEAVFATATSFEAVYHLNENPGGGSNSIVDRTANSYDGTPSGMDSNDTIAGRIGKGLDFDGSNDYVQLGNVAIHNNTKYTVSTWIKGASAQSDLRYYSEGSTTDNTPLFTLQTDAAGSDGTAEAYIRDDAGTEELARNSSASSGDAFDGTWHHLVWVDSSDGSNYDFTWYIDGQASGTGEYSQSTKSFDVASIGAILRASPGSYITAQIDEFRLSSTTRSADWIKLCYENQKSGQTLVEIQSMTENYSSWSYSIDITLNTSSSGADVSGSVSDFPVLIHLNPDNFPYFSQTNTGGTDIRFASSGGTHLSYEIERWVDGTSDSAWIWVKTDVTGNSSTQYIVMYWGNAGAADSSDGEAVFATATSFEAVYHLNENPGGGSNSIVDRTANSYDGTPSGMDSNDTIAGQIGKGLDFDGSNDYVQLGNVSIHNNTKYTVSTWIKGASAQADKRYYCEGSTSDNNPLFTLQTDAAGSDGTGEAYIRDDAGTEELARNASSSSGNAFDGTWHHLVWVDSSDGSNYDFTWYIDGQASGTGQYSRNAKSLNVAAIGAVLRASSSNYIAAQIDEFRLCSTTRSADWIKLCYENQKSNQSLVELVNEDYADWSYSTEIILNTSATGADVSSSVTDFPLLVHLNPGNFTYFSQTEADGADIRFATSDDTHLPYEIERWYDGTSDNDSAWIWVKTDIAGNNSTQYIVMYWGKSGAVDRSNGGAVFETDSFAAVYHMNQASGNAVDMTSNGLSGTSNGGITYEQSGNIGYANGFDGNGDYFDAGNSAQFQMDGTDKVTISAWVKRTGAAAAGLIEGIAGKYEWTASHSREYMIGNHSSGGFIFYLSDDGMYETDLAANVVPANDTWYYVTGMMDAQNMYIFVNGEEKNSSVETTIYGSTNATFKIGRMDDDGSTYRQYFNGTIDEVRIEKAARSADWIKLCYENQKSDQTLVELLRTYTWDISTTSGIQPGDGTWGTHNYWTQSSGDGTVLSAWPGAGNKAIFGGSDGSYTITVNGTQYADSIHFENSGYTLSSGTIDMGSGTSYISVTSAKSATITSTIDGSGDLTFIGGPTLSTLNLTGTNTFSGTITLQDYIRCNLATLADGGSNCAIGAASGSASNIVLDGAQFRYVGSGSSTDRLFTVTENGCYIYNSGSGALSYTNSGSIAFSGSGARTIEIGGNYTGSNTFAPVIGDGTGGATSILKTSSACTWIFSGANTYTGSTMISGGTLVITGSTNAGSTVSVADGATLGGTGSIGGAVNTSGTIAPGTPGAIGNLTINGDLTFDTDASLSVTINGTTAGTGYDRVTLSSDALTLGSATLSISLGYAASVNDAFTIITGASSHSGTFNGLAEGDTIASWYDGDLYHSTISYTGGSGHDVILTVISVESSASTYDSWSYSKAIGLNTTATGADISGDVLDFPVLVRLTPDNFSSFSQTLAGGADIRFSKLNGSPLDYHIERWYDDGSDNDTAEIWVKIDTVYGNSTMQGFLMYWGKSGVSDNSNSASVFDPDNDFTAVYLLDQSSGAATDYSAYGNNGSANGDLPDQQAGMIGKGQSLDGSDDYFDCGNGDAFDMSAVNKYTISAWVQPGGTQSNGVIQGIASKWQWYSGNWYEYALSYHQTNGFFFGQSSNGSNYEFIYDNIALPAYDGTWYYLTGTFDGTTMRFYVNASLNGSSTDLSSVYHTSNGEFRIGLIDNDGGSNQQFYNGIIDHVVLSRTARSADWIRLCYENQKTEQTLVIMYPSYFWDSSTGSGIQPVSGTWGSDDYWTIDGVNLFAWPGSGYGATFGGTDGSYTVTVSGTQYVDSLAFTNDGYTLSGGTIDLGTGSAIYVTSADTAVVSSAITGSGGLTKTGTGTLTLSGANTFTDATTVTEGMLLVTGSTASGSAVTVDSDAELGGTGTVNGALTVNGSLLPGTEIGIFNAAGGIAFSGGAGCVIEVNGSTTAGTDYDQIAVTGSVTLASASLTIAFGYEPSVSDAFTIISNDGTEAISGTFSQGSSISVSYGENLYVCSISYTGGSDNNDVVVTVTSVVQGGVYSEWTHSRELLLNTTATGADVSGNVLDFPVLVRLNPGTFNHFDQTQTGGSDIRFAKTNGIPLPYAIESWRDFNNDNDTAEIWVKLDTVYGNNATQSFVMFWGKPDVADSSNSEAVFDTTNSFEGVWHLNEDPSGGTGSITDGTFNSNDGTPDGDMDATDRINGNIAGGLDFDSAGSQYINAGTDNSLDPGSGDFTLSGWFKTSLADVGFIAGKGAHTGSYTRHALYMNLGQVVTEIDDDATAQLVTSTSTYNDENWHYGTAVRDGSNLRLYIDGNEDGNSPTDIGSYGSLTNSNSFRIGALRDFTSVTDFFNGSLDEIRFSTTARSADWIRLCYENQKTTQTLVVYEDYATWGFSKNIMINTSGVTTTDCINFPLLVRLDENNFDFSQAQGNGEDIRFSKSDGLHFPYEIEQWDSTNTSAAVWVLIDTVFGNNSSQYIKLYWSKSGVTSKSDGEAVFAASNNYSGVWHLNEEGNATALDATSAGNDGTANGFTTSSDVSGVIGIGREFNGSATGGDYIELNNNVLEEALSAGDQTTTISFWFKADATTATKTIVWEGDSAGNGWGSEEELHFSLGASFTATPVDDYLTLYLGDTDDYNTEGNPLHATTSFTDVSNWRYAAVTIDNTTGTESATLYLDGSSVSTDNGNISATFTGWNTNTRFGRPGADSRYFDGKLDEVIISDTIHSADWIKLCYETQKPDADLLSCDSADAFRPLTIRRETTGSTIDSIIIATSRWALRFNAATGGGIDFLAKDSSSTNQLDKNLFCLLYNGSSSASGTGTLELLDSSIVFARVRQTVAVDGQPFSITYTVLGSGRIYTDVTTFATSALSGGLEFRIANDNVAATYDNIMIGENAATCEGVAHIDSATGRYDLIMAPFDIWSDADQVTSTTLYTGIKSSSWGLGAGKGFRRQFMVDFSHTNITDSTDVYRYIANYRCEDTLSFYAGTPLLEQAWENHLKGHWSFDEGYGDTVTDNSGNSHTAVIATTERWTDGYWLGGADSLNGSDSISVAHSTDFDGRYAHTVLAWIKPAAALSTSASIVKKYSSGDVGYKLGGGSGGTLLYSINNGGSAVELASTSALSTDTWYHVGAVMTSKTDTMKLYINGEVDTVQPGSFGADFGTNTVDLILGKGFNGVIDDVRFYDDYLYDKDIKAIYLKGFSPELGMYSVRASNDNTIHCIMHGSEQLRSLPVLQIKNYWATTLPLYVYVDGVGLTQGTDYYAALDDGRNQLTIGLNRVINTDATIFIDDSSDGGNNLVGPTKKMYWGDGTIDGDDYFYVKNTSGTYFGDEGDNEFYMSWNMSTNSPKDGEVLYLHSSVTNPGSQIDTTGCTNLIPGSDANNTLGSYSLYDGSNYIRTTTAVSNSFSYTVEESTTVRVRLRVNERQVSSTGSYNIVTHWTIYPTGQLFRYDSLYSLSFDPLRVYMPVYLNDQTNSGFAKDEDQIRAAVLYSAGFPDMVVSWLAMKNASGFQSFPFDADTITTKTGSTNVGFDFCQSSSTPAKWDMDLDPIETAVYIDIHHAEMNSSSMDSISNGVQYIGLSGGAALTSIGSGTLITTSDGDLNGDGFNEKEGAYIIQASNNTVNFNLPALGDTCRYYPAFKITDYLAANKPQYIFAYDDSDTTALVEGYQYNCYLNQVDRELVIQIDSIFCATSGIYISADKTLAVKMSNFEARAGNGCDTLIWRTESEQENLGYRLLRRVKPEFYDSAYTAFTDDDSAQTSEVSPVSLAGLFKRGSLKAPDTSWTRVNRKLIPGAEKGVSHGPRDYRYVDYQVHNEVLYEYRLVAVDYHQREEEYGPITVMPKYLFPTKLMLGLNYPNPFRYMTTIRFALPTDAKVSINIYTLKGQLVRRLITPDKKMPAMYHKIRWDGKNDHGTRVAAGPYIYRMKTGKFRKAKVMMMLK